MSSLSLKSNLQISTVAGSRLSQSDIYLQAEYEALVGDTMAAASKKHRVGLMLCGTGRLCS